MALPKISEYAVEATSFADTDRFDISTGIGGTPATKYVKWSTIKASIDTIYSADGTLAAAREVAQGGFTLGFTNGLVGFGVAVPTLGRVQIDGVGDTQATKGIHHRNQSGTVKHIWYDDGATYYNSSLSVGILTPGTNTGVSVNGAQFQFDYRSVTTFIGADAYGYYSEKLGANVGFSNIAAYLTASGADNNYALLVNAGDVGIGVLAPTEKLHLVGNFRYVDGNEGANKVLQSDANGVANWAAATSIYTANGTIGAIRTVTMNNNVTWDAVATSSVFGLSADAAGKRFDISYTNDSDGTIMETSTSAGTSFIMRHAAFGGGGGSSNISLDLYNNILGERTVTISGGNDGPQYGAVSMWEGGDISGTKTINLGARGTLTLNHTLSEPTGIFLNMQLNGSDLVKFHAPTTAPYLDLINSTLGETAATFRGHSDSQLAMYSGGAISGTLGINLRAGSLSYILNDLSIGLSTSAAKLNVKGGGSGANKTFLLEDSGSVDTFYVQDNADAFLGGTFDALKYKVNGVAGANFSGAITNLTVVDGIVTAAS